MKRPDSVQVGPTRYTVHWDRAAWLEACEWFSVTADEGYGLTDPLKAKIWISPHLGEDVARETFFHEVMHACQLVAGVLSAEDNLTCEEHIRRTSPNLLDCLRRDVNVMSYLVG